MTMTQVIGSVGMVGMIARSWSRGQKDKRRRSSPLSSPLRLRLMKAHVDPILSTFVDLGHGLKPSFALEKSPGLCFETGLWS